MQKAWLFAGSLLWVTGCGGSSGEATDDSQPSSGGEAAAPSGGSGGAVGGGGGSASNTGGQASSADSGAGASGAVQTDGAVAASNGPCDLAGTWAAQRINFANVNNPLVPGAQKNSQWYFFDVVQQGDDLTLERGVWCGDTTTGDATINFSAATTDGIRKRMQLAGRRGTYRVSGDACELELERAYSVTAVVDDDTYLPGVALPPGRIAGNPELSTLPKLPTKLDDPSAEDWDGDGKAGVQYLITDSPLGSGVRHAVQRAWNAVSGKTPQNADEFLVDATYDFEEVALEAVPILFSAVAVVRKGAPNGMRWKRVASDFAQQDDADTCKAVRALLPHTPLPRDAP